MTGTRQAAGPTPWGARQLSFVQDRVLAVLVTAAFASAAGLSFLSVAPNRLMSGTGIGFAELAQAWRTIVLLPGVVLAVVPFLRPTCLTRTAVVVCASLVLAGLAWLAGDEAQRQTMRLSGVARVSPAGGFWVLVALAWFAGADALAGLVPGRALRTLAGAAILLPVLVMLGLGKLDQLAVLREYANRQDVFEAAWQQHLEIVMATLIPATLAGVPLGIAAARNRKFASALFSLLNVIQTVPSIALFSLLIAPLSWLAGVLPELGIRGVGLLPAVIALTAYALLPIVHGTVSGMRQVPSGVVEAALAMGFTQRQLFWKVEAPLALPVLLSGLRVTAVQIVGLAVVAALIGAGGLGSLIFQGLAGGALDLVMLGVLPVVAIAMTVDAGMRMLTAALEDRRR